MIKNMDIIQATSQIKTDWRHVIEAFDDWETIESFLKREKEVYGKDLAIFPEKNDIFRCFNYFNIKETRVVIIGQDPYHGRDQAIGLSFAVKDTVKTPPSLVNIKKELKTDVNRELASSTLEQWARQGVLLLNTALTVREHCASSHMKVWRDFTDYIINYINEETEGVVFLAWGAFAHNRLEQVNTEKHHLLVSSHPSPLSATRSYKQFPKFIGSKPFSRINSLLKREIHW